MLADLVAWLATSGFVARRDRRQLGGSTRIHHSHQDLCALSLRAALAPHPCNLDPLFFDLVSRRKKDLHYFCLRVRAGIRGYVPQIFNKFRHKLSLSRATFNSSLSCPLTSCRPAD
jgi:hypothetical protein